LLLIAKRQTVIRSEEIRRDRDFFFGDFPKQEEFDEMIKKVSEEAALIGR
jgi:hypothetical protein